MADQWTWEFQEFKSDREGCPVKRWYDALSEDDTDEVINVVRYLQTMTSRPWPRDFFDPLEGEGGISEIRIPEIAREANGRIVKITYRIYGVRDRRSYTFLHATDKKRRNDLDGKGTANRRFGELRDNRATVRKFNFEKRSVVEITPRTGSTS